MDAAEVLRAARRRAGLSQRQLAVRAGVALSTVSDAESGRRSPSTAVLQAVLDVAGLELSVDVRPPELSPAQREHLRLSLARRLHRALGGHGRPTHPPPLPRWQQLQALARVARVHLHGELALRMWLPADTPLEAPEVCTELLRGCHLPPGTTDLLVRETCAPGPAPVVVLPRPRCVVVDPPADLALDPEHALRRPDLRSVARALHAQAPRDEAGRRPRAHRDPDHQLERAQVFHTKRFAHLRMPDATDLRSWRLEDDATLVDWLRRHGYPV